MIRSLTPVTVLVLFVALDLGCASNRVDANLSVNSDDSVALGATSSSRCCAAQEQDDDDDDDDEVDVPLSEVPQIVKDAAIDAVPGIVLEEAERETENGVVVYSLEGEVDGVDHEVEVTEAGEVLEIETDDQDDD